LSQQYNYKVCSSVHIVAQWANRYIVAFQIAISYHIYLSGGGGHAVQMVSTIVSYWWLPVMCSLRMRPLADADLQNFYRAALNAGWSSQEKDVCLSVCLSVCQTCGLWQNGTKKDFYTIWKVI